MQPEPPREPDPPREADPRPREHTRGRAMAGLGVALLMLAALTAVLLPVRANLALASVVLLYLSAVVVVAVVGGVWPALAAALTADILVNFFFVPPYHTLAVDSRDHLIALGVFVAVAVTTSVTVDLAARNRAMAARSGVEAALLARISAAPVGEGSLTDLLEHIRATFGMSSAALIEDPALVVAQVGAPPSPDPALSVPAGDRMRLVADGPQIFAADPRFLRRLAAAAARTLQAERLAAQAAQARELAEVDRVRTALLAAVGHDLRTPLAGIKAAVSGLRDPDIDLTEAQQAELLATIEESSDLMNALVENLLAMSRLQAGALLVEARPVALDEVVAAVLLRMSTHEVPVEVDVPDDLPLVRADPGLLERVVANLVANASQASQLGNGPPQALRLYGHAAGDRVLLHVIDHGRGVPVPDRERIFAPFQRLDDRGGGQGLGLAIARGFTEAMGGTLDPSDTLGGGLTMTISLAGAG